MKLRVPFETINLQNMKIKHALMSSCTHKVTITIGSLTLAILLIPIRIHLMNTLRNAASEMATTYYRVRVIHNSAGKMAVLL